MSEIDYERVQFLHDAATECARDGTEIVLDADDVILYLTAPLLALRERAEPDYIRYNCGCCGWETIEDWRDNDVCPKCNYKPLGKTELYTAPPAPLDDDKRLDELTMWVKRLAWLLRRARPNSKLPNDAMDYLKAKGLISAEDVLR